MADDSVALLTGVPVRRGAMVFQAGPGDPLPRAGAGTAEAANKHGLIATLEGLAVVSDGKASVTSAEIHYGDIGMSQTLTGTGNVVVTGSIMRGAKVKANGSLVILGEVIMAQVEAMGSVVLRKGCMGASVTAGVNHHRYRLSLEQLQIVQASLQRLISIVEELKGHPSFRTLDLTKNLQPLLEVLAVRSFADFTVHVAEAVKRCQIHEYLAGNLTELTGLLRNRFTGFAFLTVTRDEVETALNLCGAAIQELESAGSADRDVFIVGGPAEDSVVKALGSVVLAGANLKRCRVEADKSVRVEGDVQGGTVRAGLSIAASRVTESAVLSVSGGGVIRVDGATSEVVAQVGHLTERLRAGAQATIIRQKGNALEVCPAGEVN
ncbi:MAG TPA: FapA family protein [Symbiobacteriaceae bacterium]|nr:FapA family protein [Symbiobacteriaceae bacterium]